MWHEHAKAHRVNEAQGVHALAVIACKHASNESTYVSKRYKQ